MWSSKMNKIYIIITIVGNILKKYEIKKKYFFKFIFM